MIWITILILISVFLNACVSKSAYEQALSDLADAKEQIQSLQADNLSLQDDLDALQSKHISLNDTLDKTESNLQEAQSTIKKMQVDINQASSQIKSLENDIKDSESQAKVVQKYIDIALRYLDVLNHFSQGNDLLSNPDTSVTDYLDWFVELNTKIEETEDPTLKLLYDDVMFNSLEGDANEALMSDNRFTKYLIQKISGLLE
jgi:DNA repair exonuclease SbcCD ATPase subunit